MKHNHFLTITLNFLAVVLLVSLLAAPIYFAKNVAQIAGVKNQTNYLIVSQIDKFPGMMFSQDGARYEISFERQNPSQAYLSVVILTNPTNEAKNYNLISSGGSTKIFFSEDFQNPKTEIKIPAKSTIPISLLSEGDAPSVQTVEFTIETKQ